MRLRLMLSKLLISLFTLLLTLTTVITGYLTVLTVLAIPKRRSRPAKPQELPFFYVLLPAHNEELVIARTIASLQALDYPPSHFSICVVADNCTDRTAEIAREQGTQVFERTNLQERGKGYALHWLLDQLLPTAPPNTAYLFIDADSTLSPNFLQVAARELANGAAVIQAYYGVANPDESWRSALRYIALAAINYARLQGRERLGLSAGLRGNGMVFSAEIMKDFGWQAYTRAEDAELHAMLLLQGRRVTFVPDCQVWGLMPVTEKQARSQDARWEGGRVEIARQYVPRLLKAIPGRPLRQQLALLDDAIELATPPLSLLASLGLVGWGSGWWLRSRKLQGLGSLLISELILYIGASLLAARVPPRFCLALIYAPFFIVWKISLYIYAVFSRKQQKGWIRTTRVAER